MGSKDGGVIDCEKDFRRGHAIEIYYHFSLVDRDCWEGSIVKVEHSEGFGESAELIVYCEKGQISNDCFVFLFERFKGDMEGWVEAERGVIC